MDKYEDGYRTGYNQALEDAESLAMETFGNTDEKMNFRRAIAKLMKVVGGN